MTRRLLVIGGDAGGMSAASQAVRLTEEPLDVVVVERGRWTSYSACGIPYWIAGTVDGPEALVARSPEEHRARGIDVRLETTAVAVDPDRGRVRVEGASTGWLGFDELVIATGARPRRPDLPGIGSGGVLGVQNLDQGQRVVDAVVHGVWMVDGGLDGVPSGAARGVRPVRRVVIVGAGYIGVEMAEALCTRGLDVTVLQHGAEPLNTLDPEMGALVRSGLNKLGADVVRGAEVTGFEAGADGWVAAVVTESATYPADLVILGMGIEPASDLAADAGLPTGETGGIRTDDRMAVADGIWAAGDCVEVRHRVTGRPAFVPLGTHANKQGRVIGRNVTGGSAAFPGVVGTAITRVGDLEVARTGLSLRQAQAAGFSAVAETVETSTIAAYMPDSERMHLRMVAERGSGRLLGTQIVGGPGSAKRIDVCAMALWHEMTVGDLGMTDLAYAPPFSSVWDPVLVGAWKVARSV